MENFADRLIKEIEKYQNPSCVGLDSDFERFPNFLKKKRVSQAIFWFNKAIIDFTFDLVPAYKIQIAFYEKYKLEGLKAFEKTIFYLKEKKKIIIVDAKRGDVEHTARAYSFSFLNPRGFDVDAITLNPYLGRDSILPFLEDAKKYQKGIFVLVKTSNPSSKEIQNQKLRNGKELYQLVAKMVKELGKNTEGKFGYQIVGAVVGATFKKEMKILRKMLPKAIFLVPGFQTQGGKLKDLIFAFNKDKRGALINNSRGIIFAFENENFKKRFGEKKFYLAAREATLEMKQNLNSLLKTLK